MFWFSPTNASKNVEGFVAHQHREMRNRILHIYDLILTLIHLQIKSCQIALREENSKIPIQDGHRRKQWVNVIDNLPSSFNTWLTPHSLIWHVFIWPDDFSFFLVLCQLPLPELWAFCPNNFKICETKGGCRTPAGPLVNITEAEWTELK